MSTIDEETTTLRCWRCMGGDGGANNCHKCSGTGRLFWAGGYAYPYTPEGEKQMREDLRLKTRLRR